MYHLKLFEFDRFPKSCREHNTSSVESIASIVLPFQVQAKTFKNYSFSWTENDIDVVHVEFCCHEVYYGAQKDNESFEIC